MASSVSSDPDSLIRQWEGQIVPRSFNPGFVTLSYVVSLIGAASTLELINRRTAPRGVFNHLLLFGAAVTQGGSIFCMHYVGNRAIELADGQIELQIAYASGFTALSFFVPVIVLLAAFVAIGTNNKISWWRVIVGGSLAGSAIAGMHFIGDFSISNYACVYAMANIVGSALIAVAASITALSLFFVFRAAWTSSWWKRAMSAVLLACAVSGMHYCASVGTQYRLLSLNTGNNELSRNATVIIVMCLSVGACVLLAGFAIYSARTKRHYATKAQQVVLAAAVFDQQGRVLVSPDGLLPSVKITASLVEKTPQDSFTEAHPLFHWIFRVSRNWASVVGLIPGITRHLSQLSQSARNSSRRGIALVDDHGAVIDNYETVLKELFCAAAAALADKLKSNIEDVGQLWDEILPTGAGITGAQRGRTEGDPDHEDGHKQSEDDLAEKGERLRELAGRGSLMFLVRKAQTARETDALEAAGYRFAEIHQISGIIGSTLRIGTRSIETRLRKMAARSQADSMLQPGVYMGLFGVRARVGTPGFDVLVRKDAHNLLPTVPLGLGRLEEWHNSFIRRLDRMTPRAVSRALENTHGYLPKERAFAKALSQGVAALRAYVNDAVFEEALLTCKIAEVPCRGEKNSVASILAFHVVIPIHLQVAVSKCDFIPLSFFRVQQLVYKDSPYHLAFSRAVHRELSPIINSVPSDAPRETFRDGRFPFGTWKGRAGTATAQGRSRPRGIVADEDGNPIPTNLQRSSSTARDSTHTGSTLKLWQGGRSSNDMCAPSADSGSETGWKSGQAPNKTAYGGIMVSQEVTVQVHDSTTETGMSAATDQAAGPRGDMRPAPTPSTSQGSVIEMKRLARRDGVHIGSQVHVSNVEFEGVGDRGTFVDELFAVCVDGQ